MIVALFCSIFVILLNLIIHLIDKIFEVTLFLLQKFTTTVLLTYEHIKYVFLLFVSILADFKFKKLFTPNFNSKLDRTINDTAIKRYFVLSM